MLSHHRLIIDNELYHMDYFYFYFDEKISIFHFTTITKKKLNKFNWS